MGDLGLCSNEERRRLGRVQALDDAMDYRLARVAAPCGDCEKAAGGKCDDHSSDLDLIEFYRHEQAVLSPDSDDSWLATSRG